VRGKLVGESRMKKYFYILGIITLISIGIISICFNLQKGTDKIMELNVSGGFASMNIHFEYYKNGSVIYNNLKTSTKISVILPNTIVKELETRINTLLETYPYGLDLKPDPNSADYFTYNLQVFSNGKKVIYRWTDISNSSKELFYVAQFIFEINNFVLNRNTIFVYLKIDELNIKSGEKAKIFAVAMNPTQENFSYSSPTPCSPDFRLYLYTLEGEKIELFPTNYNASKPCIQVVQTRVLKPGDLIQSEYEYTFSKEGIYTIEVLFPYADWNQVRYDNRINIEVSK